MPIEIKNADVIIKLTEERLKAINQEFEQVIADEATRIVLRTQSGVDVNGQPFEPYTEDYAKFRTKKGRSTTPNLLFTGNMQNAIESKVEKTGDSVVGTIFFNSAQEAVKAQGNQKKRQFFGLSDEQVKRITEKLKSAK